MIRQETAQAAIDVAEEFDRRGLGISFKEDSLMQELYTAATVDTVQPVVMSVDGYLPTAESVMAESAVVPIGSDRSVHDEVLEDIVTEVADAVRQHVSFAKNTVRPLIRTLVENVEAALKAMPETATFNPDIKRVSLPAPMLSNMFEAMARDYAQTPFYPITKPMALPELSAQEVTELLHTGSVQMDGDIDSWLASVGADFAPAIYKIVFTQSVEVPVSTTFASVIEDPVTGADAALVAFLVGKKLLDNPPEGVTQSLTDYRIQMGDIISQAGLRLVHAYEDAARQEQAGQLVISYDKSCVRVVASVFDRWVDAGGKMAALFGSLLSDRPMYHDAAINANAQEYEQLWERQNAMLTMAQQSNRYRNTIEMLKTKTEVLVYDQAQALGFADETVREALRCASEFIDTLTLDDVGELWKTCTKIVAGCVFYYTDSLKILEGVDRFCADSPDMDPSEAALLSTIDYLVDFVVDQLYVFDL